MKESQVESVCANEADTRSRMYLDTLFWLPWSKCQKKEIYLGRSSWKQRVIPSIMTRASWSAGTWRNRRLLGTHYNMVNKYWYDTSMTSAT